MSYFRNVQTEEDDTWQPGGTYTFEVYIYWDVSSDSFEEMWSLITESVEEFRWATLLNIVDIGDDILGKKLLFPNDFSVGDEEPAYETTDLVDGVTITAYEFIGTWDNEEIDHGSWTEIHKGGWLKLTVEVGGDVPIDSYDLIETIYSRTFVGEIGIHDWEVERYDITIGGLGNLQVMLAPTKAVSDGAKWKVDSGEWLDSGTIVEDLSAGTHIVACKEINTAKWVAPPNKNVVIIADKTAILTRTYIANAWPNRRYVWPNTAPDPWPPFPPFWWPDFWWEGTDLDPWPDEPPTPWPKIPPGGDYVDPDWYWNENEGIWLELTDEDWPEIAVAGGGRYNEKMITVNNKGEIFYR